MLSGKSNYYLTTAPLKVHYYFVVIRGCPEGSLVLLHATERHPPRRVEKGAKAAIAMPSQIDRLPKLLPSAIDDRRARPKNPVLHSRLLQAACPWAVQLGWPYKLGARRFCSTAVRYLPLDK